MKIKLLPIFIAAFTAVTMVTVSAQNAETPDDKNGYIAVYEEGEVEDSTDETSTTKKQEETTKSPSTTKKTEETTKAPSTTKKSNTSAPAQPDVPQKPNNPQTPATQPTTKKHGILGGIEAPDNPKDDETTMEMTTSTDVSGNVITNSPNNTYYNYTAPDLSLSDAQANARKRKSIMQVAAATGVGLTAAAVLVIKLIHDGRKNRDED